MLSTRPDFRLRASILVVPVLLVPLLLSAVVGCSAPPDTDLVIYKAPVDRIEGRPRSRSLVVLGTLRALGLQRSPAGEMVVREGPVAKDDWDGLRENLGASKHLRPEPTPGEGLLNYQIFARLGSGEFQLRRRVDEPVAKAVASARERLEAQWEALPVAADPVDALESWVSSPSVRVRGLATQGLLLARTSPSVPERGQERADLIIHGRLESETDAAILELIRDSLKDVSER